ncbi:bifunctional aldolase/short-chain dehydrogenase [bacterium]|nr:bifunctional aldolase/short-chain dehydrogenase [bacterium]
MKNRYDVGRLKEFKTRWSGLPADLVERVYTSRLIGENTSLVLHGGGNTSVKTQVQDINGKDQNIVFIKGSGWDLSTIEPEGFTGLVLDCLLSMRRCDQLSDDEMVNQLRVNAIKADAPTASIEGLLHAFLPHKFVDHSHADAILVLSAQPDGMTVLEKALGPEVLVLPYKKPGFELSKGVADACELNPEAEAVVCFQHGIFTFGDTAEESYGRMIDYVSRAEKYIENELVSQSQQASTEKHQLVKPERIARLMETIRGSASYIDDSGQRKRFIAEIRNSSEIIEISQSQQAEEFCRTGVITPDHAIRTKNAYIYLDDIPDDDSALKQVVDEKITAFRNRYDEYFKAQCERTKKEVKQLDNSPRVFLVAGVGLICLGFSRKWAGISADIAETTLICKKKAMDMGDFCRISESHVFDLEYMDLQQKKLEKTDKRDLQGQIAIVTGAAGAIGFGIADCLLAAGANVVMADLDAARLDTVQEILSEKYPSGTIEKLVFDITDYSAVEKAMTEISLRLGGIDLVVPNAGIAYVSKLEDLSAEKLNQVMAVNFMGVFNIIKASIPFMKRQNTGGNIVLISSKNVYDPGASFGAYSASKAAAHQISRIASLELAELGIRVNMINPDAVFGDAKVSSKLWDYIGPDRMKSRGLDPEGLKEYYRNRNLLKETVLAEHVGNAVVFFASNKTPTTGATLPVDGGVAAAAPR